VETAALGTTDLRPAAYTGVLPAPTLRFSTPRRDDETDAKAVVETTGEHAVRHATVLHIVVSARVTRENRAREARARAGMCAIPSSVQRKGF
jgi:hypothetical protein